MKLHNLENIPERSSTSVIFNVVSREYPDSYVLPEHWHQEAQLIYAVSGVMELSCSQDFWVISPQQALWVPPKISHQLKARGRVSLRTVFFQKPYLPDYYPNSSQSLVVSPLLRELIKSAESVTNKSLPESREVHLLKLLIDEIQWAKDIPLKISMPKDSRLQKICLSLLKDPSNKSTLTEWGTVVGASPRTLSRLFHAELGSSFSIWRQQVRIFTAIPRLNLEESIVQVAMDMGYDSAGAFSSAFRRTMGVTPRDFRTRPCS
jgi:AraC-like DNA-binding protein